MLYKKAVECAIFLSVRSNPERAADNVCPAWTCWTFSLFSVRTGLKEVLCLRLPGSPTRVRRWRHSDPLIPPSSPVGFLFVSALKHVHHRVASVLRLPLQSLTTILNQCEKPSSPLAFDPIKARWVPVSPEPLSPHCQRCVWCSLASGTLKPANPCKGQLACWAGCRFMSNGSEAAFKIWTLETFIWPLPRPAGFDSNDA